MQLGVVAALGTIYAAVLAYSRVLRAPSDDAYICFVYARNLLEGNGLTYNGAVVEGCTSTSWVFLVAGLGTLGIEPPLAGELLSSVSGLLVLLATYQLGRALELGAFAALLPVALVAASGDFAFYLSVGMEQLLFTALAAYCTALLLSGNLRERLLTKRLAALAALMILTRPQGLLIAALLYGAAFAMLRSWSGMAQAAFRLSLVLLPILALKWAYFGYPLPNTFYVKGNAGLANLPHGLQYLGSTLPRFGPLLVLAVPALLSRFWREPPQRDLPLLLLGFAGVWIGAIAVLGGDNLVGARMLLPALPWISVALVRLAVPADEESPALPFAATLATLVACGGLSLAFQANDDVRDHATRWRRNFPIRKGLGLHLRKSFPSDTLVAVEAAGIIPYYSRLPTLDQLGLNNVHIAHFGQRDYGLPVGHQVSDPKYVLSQRPELILFGSAARRRPNRVFAALPEFRRWYAATEWKGLGVAYQRRGGTR